MKRNFTFISLAFFMLIRFSASAHPACCQVENHYYFPDYCYSINADGMLQIDLPLINMQVASDQEIAHQFLQVIYAVNQFQGQCDKDIYINWANYFSHITPIFIDMVAAVLPNGNTTTLSLDFTSCTENSLMYLEQLTSYKANNLERYTISWAAAEADKGQLYLAFGNEESIKSLFNNTTTAFVVTIH